MRQLSETLKALLEEASQRKSSKRGSRTNQLNSHSNVQNSHSDNMHAAGSSTNPSISHDASAMIGNLSYCHKTKINNLSLMFVCSFSYGLTLHKPTIAGSDSSSTKRQRNKGSSSSAGRGAAGKRAKDVQMQGPSAAGSSSSSVQVHITFFYACKMN